MAEKLLQTELGTATEQAYKFDGTNMIDIFPVLVVDSSNPTSPNYANITIQGVAYRTEVWDIGDERTYKWELNHMYLSGEDCEPHVRVFPEDDNAGTVVFQYEYFVLHVDGTTSAGGTVSGTATISAGDKTANTGKYISIPITGTSLVSGDMLIGVFSRITGTYASDVSVSEIGMHIPVGKLGDTL